MMGDYKTPRDIMHSFEINKVTNIKSMTTIITSTIPGWLKKNK